MRGYLAYVYGKGAHFEVHEELFCIRVRKRTTFRYGFGPPKGPPEGARDASRPKVDEELQSQNTPPENIFFYRFSGGPEGSTF
jgi:hypothetical protein